MSVRSHLAGTASLVVLLTATMLAQGASPAAAYSWQPLNTAVSGTTSWFDLQGGSLRIRCRGTATGRTSSSYSSALQLTFALSQCRGGPFESPVTVTSITPSVTLNAIRQSMTSGSGEGSVFNNGLYKIVIPSICTVVVNGERWNYPGSEEFRLWESQYSGSSIYIRNEFGGVAAEGPYASACIQGSWFLDTYLSGSNLSPSNLRIGYP